MTYVHDVECNGNKHYGRIGSRYGPPRQTRRWVDKAKLVFQSQTK